MVFMPPRHGKSELASRRFPAWYLGAFPQHQIIAASYNSELASDFGRDVRNIVASREYHALFESQLAPDSQAANRWHTSAGGSYVAAGVGTAITGRGAHVLLIDDPLKDREEADSSTTRNRVWDWYTSTAYTRLMPGGAIVLIQCMTGDTPVRMADGREVPLRDIRKGDLVATYRNGVLCAARVVNWASNGRDYVYGIKTTSGRFVRANGRHPFLVNESGEAKWVRTKDLRLGQEIFRVNGGNGKARLAHGKAATSRLGVEATARITTTKNDGLMAFVRLLLTESLGVLRTLSIAMGSLLRNMIGCLSNKAVSAQFASSHQAITCDPIGAENSALTTATTQIRLGRYCATTVTLSSAMQKLLSLLRPQQNTSDFITDKIVEIVYAGIEEVFDVQIEGTENFIANGLVSHNTRWHEDDLAGRLLTAQNRTGGDRWDVLELKAINDEGEALWPAWYPIEELERIRSVVGPRDWSALYQQSPVPDGRSEFRRDWLCWYHDTVTGEGMNKYILVDPAGEKKKTSDRTAMWVVGLNTDGNYYLLDFIYDRLNLTERARELMRLHRKWKPQRVGYEKYGKDSDIEAVKMVQERENYRFDITPLGGQVKKEDRIRRLVPLFEGRKVYMPPTMHRTLSDGKTIDLVELLLTEEYDRFPVAAHDDGLDCLARILDPDLNAVFPLIETEPERYAKRRHSSSAWAA